MNGGVGEEKCSEIIRKCEEKVKKKNVHLIDGMCEVGKGRPFISFRRRWNSIQNME